MNVGSDMNLFELLAHTAEEQRQDLVLSIVAQAQKGEKSALDLIAKTLLEQKFKGDERIKLEKRQLQDIVLCAAERIAAARASKAA